MSYLRSTISLTSGWFCIRRPPVKIVEKGASGAAILRPILAHKMDRVRFGTLGSISLGGIGGIGMLV